MRTAILVLSVDEAPRLAASLPAARAQEAAEVLVIDNASTDATKTVAEEQGARYMRLRERVSYCAALNAGLAATDAEAVLLLNADCVLDAGFLAAALPRLGERGVGSVAPKLIRATGMTPETRLHVIDAAGMFVDRRRKNGLVGHGEPADRYGRRAEAFGGDGAAVLYRRETLDHCAVGGEVLDEDFALWAADADLAWRARLLGWRCVYEPGARAWHVRFYSPTTRPERTEEHRRLQFRNRYLMIAKNETWAGLLRDLPIVLGYEILALGHVLLRERHLLRGYAEAVRLLPAARRRRRVIQARARLARVPFGLKPPA
jgi:GT2 family glycosyltransferase